MSYRQMVVSRALSEYRKGNKWVAYDIITLYPESYRKLFELALSFIEQIEEALKT